MSNVIFPVLTLGLSALFNAVSLHPSCPLRPTTMLSIEAAARIKKKKTKKKNHYGCLMEGKFGSRDGGIREPQRRGSDTGDKTAAQPAFYANSAPLTPP